MNDIDGYFTSLVRRILVAYVEDKFDSVTFVNLFIPFRALMTEFSNAYGIGTEIGNISSEIHKLHSDADCYWQGLFVEDKSTISPGLLVTEADLKVGAKKLLDLIDKNRAESVV